MAARVFKTLVFLAIALVVIGFFRGWYEVASQTDPETQKITVTVVIDAKKVRADTQAVREKAEEISHPPPPQPPAGAELPGDAIPTAVTEDRGEKVVPPQ